MAAVTICSDFGAPKIKSDTVSTLSPSISHEVMGPDAMILVFWMLNFKANLPRSNLNHHLQPTPSALSEGGLYVEHTMHSVLGTVESTIPFLHE